MLKAFLLGGVLCLGASSLPAVDRWVDAVNPAVTSNNECGIVNGVWGNALVRKGFQDPKAPGSVVGQTDRLQAGDQVETAARSRLEFSSGNNILVLIGPTSKVKILGLRSFTNTDGVVTNRLDLQLVEGMVRFQARLNELIPECALGEAGNLGVLLTRGDVVLSGGRNPRFAVLAGNVSFRHRLGASNWSDEDSVIAGSGFADGAAITVAGEEAERLLEILPFSFEILRNALPPLPPPGPDYDAP
ncbi:MAG: hypothetical protein LBU79_01475 [Planctomycetota bacterium]|nr:hypothetical protein [Planctomycetota bacterium]